jgi:hypothetical protein
VQRMPGMAKRKRNHADSVNGNHASALMAIRRQTGLRGKYSRPVHTI